MKTSLTIHKRIVAFCLLTMMLLSGCGTANGPTAGPAVNTRNPLETKTPCVNITVSNPTPKVGEVVSVIGTITAGVLNPNYYGLEIRDKDADDSSLMINVLSKPPLKGADVSHIVKLVSAEYADGKAVLGLQANEAGETTIDFFVSAEDFCGDHLGNGLSPKVKITVKP